MNRLNRLHNKHGVAPALSFCRICGKDAEELALLGASCDKAMRDVHEATDGQHGSKEGYKEYGHNRIPASEPCKECKDHLKTGTIFVARDTGEYLKLDADQVEDLHGKIADAKDRFIDFKGCIGRVITVNKAWWVASPEGIRLRDPKEWTD